MRNLNTLKVRRAIPVIALIIAIVALLVSVMAYQQSCADRYFEQKEVAAESIESQRAEAAREIRREERMTFARLGLSG